MNIRFLRGLGALWLAATTIVAPATAGEDELVDYRFSSPLENGLGLTSLEDLRGKPVLIEFWGTR